MSNSRNTTIYENCLEEFECLLQNDMEFASNIKEAALSLSSEKDQYRVFDELCKFDIEGVYHDIKLCLENFTSKT